MKAPAPPTKAPVPVATPVRGATLQRQCACGQHTVAGGECDSCRDEKLRTLHRSLTGAASPNIAPPIVHEVLRSPGRPLDRETREFMEPRFGHDFSRVRVHTGARAAESARAVNARAYTVGGDVVLGAGQDPATASGRALMAHELAHVVQQASGWAGSGLSGPAVDPRPDLEREAIDIAASAAIVARPAPVTRAAMNRQANQLIMAQPIPSLARGGLLQRKCSCGLHTFAGGECTECRKRKGEVMQRSALRGAVGNAAEADRGVKLPPTREIDVIDRGGPVPRSGPDFDRQPGRAIGPSALIQRKNAGPADPISEQVTMPTTGGFPMPDGVRAAMEHRFGNRFDDVRIHADDLAGRAAQELNARAFTKGSDIYFAPGHYRVDTSVGLGLLAHELTHVVQQRNDRFPVDGGSGRVARDCSRLEDEAEHAERTAQASTARLHVRERADGGQIHRSPDLLEKIETKVFSGIEELADHLVSGINLAKNTVVAQLLQFRQQFRGLTTVYASPRVVAEWEAIYEELRAKAPSWVPVLRLSFAGKPVQLAAFVIAIPAAVLALLCALVIVLFILSAALVAYLIHRLIQSFKHARGSPETVPAEPEVRPAPRPKPEVRPVPRPKPGPAPKPGGEVGPKKTIEPIPPIEPFPIPKPERPPKEEERRNDCLRTHPSALVCSEYSNMEESVINFLINQGLSWGDIDLQCEGETSFPPGVIDACDDAPGESWHCTDRNSGEVVSIFACLCCHEDGSTGWEWRRPHFSSGSKTGRRGVKK